MSLKRMPRTERERALRTMYEYRRQLPPDVRMRVTNEYADYRPFRFLAAFALLMMLIVPAFIDGMGWADLMKERAWWADLFLLVLGGLAGSVMYDGRHGVGLARGPALTLSVGLVIALAAVLVLF
ncbi:MAG: hypothetical protein QNJ12_15295 [Ilumatobacter sp.]|uniref:hypothetical protein n=1 Tax=Ilumatobacter sp. TaxID=1967498 RepID=UPI00261B7AFD|nr:hypothetical protein [Ilumatobacter sp.]MDJ0770166.1 hypothetical protein [Ilumatobacter sp.]